MWEPLLASLPFLLAMPLLLAGSAFASGSETALFSITHAERARLRATAAPAARAIDRLLARPRRLLVLILLLNMVVNVTYFAVSSVLTTRVSGPAAVAVGLLSVLAIVILGEIVAKSVAVRKRVAVAATAAPLLALLGRALGPLVAAIDAFVIAPAARLVSPAPASSRPPVTADELAQLVTSSGRAGDLDDLEQRLLDRVIILGSRSAREVMTPRVDVPLVHADATPDERRLELIQAARAGGSSLVALVRGGGLDRGLLGFVPAKRVLAAGPDADPTRFLQRPLFIPETARLDRALASLRSADTSVALCVSEHGEVVGRVDINQIMDELLRGLAENAPAPDQEIILVGLGTWRVPGRLPIRDWADLFTARALADAAKGHRVATLAGLIVEHLGRLPVPGDRITISNLRLTVESVESHAIRTVILEIDRSQGDPPHAPDPAADPTEGEDGEHA